MPFRKTEEVVREMLGELSQGKYGVPGDRFIASRELALQKGVSPKTAFRVVENLRDCGVIRKAGRDYRIERLFPRPEPGNDSGMLIGFLATCLDNPYFAKLASCAEEFAHGIGASLIIASSNYDFRKEQERLQMFCRQGVSGILICPCCTTAQDEKFYKTLPVPYVMLGRALEHEKCDAVLVNSQKAAQEMAKHLIVQGIRDFAYVGQAGIKNDKRLTGYRAGLLEGGIAQDEKMIVCTDNYDPARCRKDILALLEKRQGKRPLGIFCYHDLLAIRVLNLCHELGISVPGQVAVAGFDDLPAASETYPALTTVSYPVNNMARIALETLYAKIRLSPGEGGVKRYLNSKLMIRESTLRKKQ